jgi:hypothetical protein
VLAQVVVSSTKLLAALLQYLSSGFHPSWCMGLGLSSLGLGLGLVPTES